MKTSVPCPTCSAPLGQLNGSLWCGWCNRYVSHGGKSVDPGLRVLGVLVAGLLAWAAVLALR